MQYYKYNLQYSKVQIQESYGVIMNEHSGVIQVGLNSLIKAKAYYSCKNYGRSFAHFLVYAELMPAHRSDVEYEFAEVLYNWGIELEAKEQVEDLCRCYLQALVYFPLNVKILNNFGVHLIRLNQNEEAEKYFKLAHNLDKNFLPAEKNLSTAKMNLVHRWHFRMLNDYDRNEIYRRVILSYKQVANCKAIDIGTGSGILSLFASENKNIDHIYAIEELPTMAKIAKDIFQANTVKNISVINKISTDLTSSDIGGRADLLIMEIFDTALFGENVLGVALHAWENLLKKEAQIIPAGGSLHIMGISCLDLIKQHRLIKKIPTLNLDNTCLTQAILEPYNAEFIRDFNFKTITTTKKVIDVNFSDVNQLEGILFDEDFIDSVILECVESGTVDVLVLWFDLHLTCENTISTNPENENNISWEQAIVYLDHPIKMNVGESFKVNVSFINSELNTRISYEPSCSQCFKSSPKAISFLNDDNLVSALELVSAGMDSPVQILDLSPFPLLGLMTAKRGGICYCKLSTDEEEIFLKHVCSINDIKSDLVINLKTDDTISESHNLFDVILMNPISQKGTIGEKCFNNLELYYNWLKPNGILLPNSVNLYVQVVSAKHLDCFNKIDDKNLFGYEIARFMNKYAVSEEWFVKLKSPYLKLSEPTLISNILQNGFMERNVSIIQDGTANGILYWFEILYEDEIKMTTCESLYYNCASFLIEEPISVQKGTILNLTVKQHCGLLKITCKNIK